MTKEELAGMMYDSLNKKIKTLPDEVLVFAAVTEENAIGRVRHSPMLPQCWVFKRWSFVAGLSEMQTERRGRIAS